MAESYAIAFAASAGEQVVSSFEAVSGKEGEWDGWIWMMDKRGVSGWVPEAFQVQDKTGYWMLRGFDAIELSVHLGEEVTVSEEVAGWAWCAGADEASGGVPVECLSASPF